MKVRFLIEAQFNRARHTIVAADLGAAIAASERDAAEIELLRGEQRAGRRLAGRGDFQRPCIRQRLVAREPEIQRGEFAGRPVARQIVVVAVRGAENVEALAIIYRQIIGAAETVLQPVVRREARGADAVGIDRAEHIVFGGIGESGRRGQRQARFLRLQRSDAAANFERLGLDVVAVEMAVIAGPNLAVVAGRADARAVGADRYFVGQAAERELPRIARRGRQVQHQGIAGRQIGVERRRPVALPRSDGRRAQIVDAERREEVPGFQRQDQPKMTAGGADLLDRGVLDPHAGPSVDQQQLPLERRKSRGPFGEHSLEHRPGAELFGAVSLQRQLRDAAFDDLDAKLAAPDVLRRNDRPAEMKAGGAIDVADRSSDRREIGLRYFFADIGLIRCNQPVLRDRDGAGDRDMAEHEQRPGIPLPLRLGELRRRQPGPPVRALARLLVIETFFRLPRIIARLVRMLRLRRKAGDQGPEDEACDAQAVSG